MMITNASVTIYNKVYDRDEGSNKYYRTVLEGVNWQDATKVLPSDTGVVSADVAEVYIPFLIDTEKKYCSPVNFNSEQEKDKFFTLAPEDIIVKGVVADELTKQKDVEHLKNKTSRSPLLIPCTAAFRPAMGSSPMPSCPRPTSTL